MTTNKILKEKMIESWWNRTLPEISIDNPPEWDGERKMSEKDWIKSVKRDVNKLLSIQKKERDDN